jgi:hypothetical protein
MSSHYLKIEYFLLNKNNHNLFYINPNVSNLILELLCIRIIPLNNHSQGNLSRMKKTKDRNLQENGRMFIKINKMMIMEKIGIQESLIIILILLH